jgi:hypothetical protein
MRTTAAERVHLSSASPKCAWAAEPQPVVRNALIPNGQPDRRKWVNPLTHTLRRPQKAIPLYRTDLPFSKHFLGKIIHHPAQEMDSESKGL